MKADSILLDLDGTLWDSIEGILETWNRVICQYPGLREPIERKEQESLMGLQMDEIANRLFPKQSEARQMELMSECMCAENAYLYKHGGKLYHNVESTLRELHKTHKLFIVSNCQSGYIEAFMHAHHLEECFDGKLSFGETQKSKGDNIKTVIRENKLMQPVYVGDTQGDLNAANQAGIPFIYAAYGFGHPERYDAIIQEFQDLLFLIE